MHRQLRFPVGELRIEHGLRVVIRELTKELEAYDSTLKTRNLIISKLIKRLKMKPIVKFIEPKEVIVDSLKLTDKVKKLQGELNYIRSKQQIELRVVAVIDPDEIGILKVCTNCGKFAKHSWKGAYCKQCLKDKRSDGKYQRTE